MLGELPQCARMGKRELWFRPGGIFFRSSFDIDYCKVKGAAEFKRGKVRRSPMDLNGSAGFV